MWRAHPLFRCHEIRLGCERRQDLLDPVDATFEALGALLDPLNPIRLHRCSGPADHGRRSRVAATATSIVAPFPEEELATEPVVVAPAQQTSGDDGRTTDRRSARPDVPHPPGVPEASTGQPGAVTSKLSPIN